MLNGCPPVSRFTVQTLVSVVTVVLVFLDGPANFSEAADFRVLPYLQNPAKDAITVRWLSETDDPGQLIVKTSDRVVTLASSPLQPATLAYNPFKPEPEDRHGTTAWLHSVRVTGLIAGSRYEYSVKQGKSEHSASFQTAPSENHPVRLIIYSDSETEPESSTTPPVDWTANTGSNRPDGITRYVVSQTTGYRENCRVIAERQPNLILVVGDLVESGGEQRDWDEFWRHNAGDFGQVASSVPLVTAPGNHENYGGPGGGYTAEGANFAMSKFLTYFETPDNGSSSPHHKGRYYRLDYGPITIISLDSSDGLPHMTASDTNHNLQGSHAPDFNPGSEQYQWLETQLADAQKKSRFTFVQFHHTMYGSGPHSIPFGSSGFSGQSGIAMRVLAPVFFRYGVDAVFSGHDELMERSMAEGSEVLPDGSRRPHVISFYDVGIGGDGLRGPSQGFDNPYRQFLVHENAPEKWDGRKLVSGGKHYGHLEVSVDQDKQGNWYAEFLPVHIFPVMDDQGDVIRWERRLYDDKLTIPESGRR